MKEYFKEAKDKYESRVASDKLKMEVENMFKNENKIWGKVIGGSLAAVAATFVFGINVSPVLAKNISEVPGFKGIVNVLTGFRYEFNEENYNANIEVPELGGILDEELEKKINLELENNAKDLIAQFEKDVKEMKESGVDGHLGVDSGYRIMADNDKILSFDIYVVNTVASSSTTHKFYNIDKKEGKLITLESLFEGSENYIEDINKFVKSEMERRNGEEEIFWIDEFKGIKEDQGFYINNDGKVVIVFDKYEIAPGYMGSPEFVLPDEL